MFLSSRLQKCVTSGLVQLQLVPPLVSCKSRSSGRICWRCSTATWADLTISLEGTYNAGSRGVVVTGRVTREMPTPTVTPTPEHQVTLKGRVYASDPPAGHRPSPGDPLLGIYPLVEVSVKLLPDGRVLAQT